MQGMENTSAIRTIPVLFHYRPIHSTSPCSSALDHRPWQFNPLSAAVRIR